MFDYVFNYWHHSKIINYSTQRPLTWATQHEYTQTRIASDGGKVDVLSSSCTGDLEHARTAVSADEIKWVSGPFRTWHLCLRWQNSLALSKQFETSNSVISCTFDLNIAQLQWWANNVEHNAGFDRNELYWLAHISSSSHRTTKEKNTHLPLGLFYNHFDLSPYTPGETSAPS